MKQLLDENKKLTKDLSTKDQQIVSVRTELQSVNKEKVEIQSGLQEVKKDLFTVSVHLKEQFDKNEHLVQTLAAMERNYTMLVKENSDLQNEVGSLREFSDLQSRAKDSVQSANLKKLASIKDKAPDLYKECMSQAVTICHLSKDLDEAIKGLETHEETIQNLKSKVKEKDIHVKRLEKIIDRLTRNENDRLSDEASRSVADAKALPEDTERPAPSKKLSGLLQRRSDISQVTMKHPSQMPANNAPVVAIRQQTRPSVFDNVTKRDSKDAKQESQQARREMTPEMASSSARNQSKPDAPRLPPHYNDNSFFFDSY